VIRLEGWDRNGSLVYSVVIIDRADVAEEVDRAFDRYLCVTVKLWKV
jgi:hypothetical protein